MLELDAMLNDLIDGMPALKEAGRHVGCSHRTPAPSQEQTRSDDRQELAERPPGRGLSRRRSGGGGPAAVGAHAHDALQLIGDGLGAALAQHVHGAADLAANCVTALRERGWHGDDDLADQLDAVLGTSAAPLLKPLAVDLDELAGIREGDPMHGSGRIDRHTGEVWHRAAIDYAREMGEEDEDESDDAERWLWVDCEGSHEGYRDMELFIGTFIDAERADRLDIAIQGSGAFRRFKDVLARWPDELDRWYAFSEERQRGRARAWLADTGYRVAFSSTPRLQA